MSRKERKPKQGGSRRKSARETAEQQPVEPTAETVGEAAEPDAEDPSSPDTPDSSGPEDAAADAVADDPGAVADGTAAVEGEDEAAGEPDAIAAAVTEDDLPEDHARGTAAPEDIEGADDVAAAPGDVAVEGGDAPAPLTPEEEAAAAARLDQRQLMAIIEAIVFASPEPITLKTLVKVLSDEPKEDVTAAFQALQVEYETRPGLHLATVAGGYQIMTRPELHDWVRRLFHERTTQKLSIQSLETLAVIAYKQPITAAEVGEIRGVNSSGVLSTLLERHLVKIVGRKNVVGRPFLYGTTKEFLIRFGLKDLNDLPKVEDMAAALGFEAPAILTERPVTEEMLPLDEEDLAMLEGKGIEGHEGFEGHDGAGAAEGPGDGAEPEGGDVSTSSADEPEVAADGLATGAEPDEGASGDEEDDQATDGVEDVDEEAGDDVDDEDDPDDDVDDDEFEDDDEDDEDEDEDEEDAGR